MAKLQSARHHHNLEICRRYCINGLPIIALKALGKKGNRSFTHLKTPWEEKGRAAMTLPLNGVVQNDS